MNLNRYLDIHLYIA